jgi:large subunit ribosomal protein L17
MCLIELVDFNTIYTKDGVAKKAKTRRSRRGGKKEDEGVETAPEGDATEGTEVEAKEKKTKKAAPKKDAPKSKKGDKKK